MRILQGTAEMEQDHGGVLETGQRQEVSRKNYLCDREREKEGISGEKRKTRERVGQILGVQNQPKSSISVAFF